MTHGNGVGNVSVRCSTMARARLFPRVQRIPICKPGLATVEGNTTTEGGGATHTHLGSTADDGGEHTHEITLDSLAFKPPYYALCYIMKIA